MASLLKGGVLVGLKGHQRRISGIYLIVLILSAFIFQSSCTQHDQEGKTAVKINRYTLTANEFEELFHEYEGSEDTPQIRANFLNNLITRKLLLEEAQRMGLDTQKDFLRSIENFWEQSLLKLVVDQKVKEIAEKTTLTEAEIEAQYQEWVKENPGMSKSLAEVRHLIEWRIRKAKEAQAMEEWNDELFQRARIQVDKKDLGIE